MKHDAGQVGLPVNDVGKAVGQPSSAVVDAPDADAAPEVAIGVQVPGITVPDTVIELVGAGAAELAPPVEPPVEPPAETNGFASFPPFAAEIGHENAEEASCSLICSVSESLFSAEPDL